MAIDDHSAGPQSPAARTMGEILRRMRCSGACGGRVEAAWLETNARVRPAAGAVTRAGGAGVAVAGGCLDNRDSGVGAW